MKAKKIILFLSTALILTACQKNNSYVDSHPLENENSFLEEKKEEEEINENNIYINTPYGKFIYSSYEIVNDCDGNPAIKVHFTYINKEEDPTPSTKHFYVTAYQRGRECLLTPSEEVDELEKNIGREVIKDLPIEVSSLFSLEDTTSPLTIKVNGDDISQSQEILLEGE